MTKKHALLVYPAFATSFWSFKFALHYFGKKSGSVAKLLFREFRGL
jgi:hypothetical protein